MSTTWDTHGVPTITAGSDEEVCRGFGHAQAVVQAREVLELYGAARGRGAALWGAELVDGDLEHARLGLDGHVDEWLAAQEAPTLRRLEAFCDGFNAACAEDERRGAGRREVLPVRPRDVVAHTLKVFLVFARFWDDGLAFPPSPGGLLGGGSSGWAVTAGRSATGEALLLANPHIPWAGAFRLFEARTVSPGRSCHGVTPIGFPWQSFAYGGRVAWTHTVNPIPQLWVYELDVTGDRYRHGGDLLAFEQHEHVVEVLGAEPVTVVERRTVHGPVVTAPDGAEVAVRVAGVLHHPAATALEGWWQMSLATSVHELLEAQDRHPLPLFNILAADDAGSIAAAYCGVTPHRPGGRFEDSMRRLPGDDPAQVWHEVNPPGSLPRVVDPACGWVQNVNETPWWFCDPPLDPADHPDGIAPAPDRLRDIRSPLSRTWLAARAQVDPSDLLSLKWQTRVRLADLVLDDLVGAAVAAGGLEEAVGALQGWDRHAGPESRGYPLFHLWAHDHLPLAAPLMDGRHLVAPAAPGGLPTGLVDLEGAAASLRRAVAVLAGRGLPPDVPYGDFGVIRVGDDEVPASGAPSFLGVFRCLELAPTPTTWQGIGGDTWVALVRFTTDGPVAAGLLVNGNSTEPTAPPQESPLPFQAAGRLRPLAPLPSVSASYGASGRGAGGPR